MQTLRSWEYMGEVMTIIVIMCHFMVNFIVKCHNLGIRN